MFFLLKDKQHERFIGGITDVPNVAIAGGAVIPLESAIGEDSFDDFKKDKHGATATLISSSSPVTTISSATVNEKGELVVTFNGGPTAAAATYDAPTGSAKIAWIIDTEAAEALSVKTA